jgi:hypothetical protein
MRRPVVWTLVSHLVIRSSGVRVRTTLSVLLTRVHHCRKSPIVLIAPDGKQPTLNECERLITTVTRMTLSGGSELDGD